jgi:hypothetical protein
LENIAHESDFLKAMFDVPITAKGKLSGKYNGKNISGG